MNKFKKWYNENKTEVQVCIAILVMYGCGYATGKAITSIKIDAGTRYLIDKNVMKFVNPVTGVEAKTYTDATKLVRDIAEGTIKV